MIKSHLSTLFVFGLIFSYSLIHDCYGQEVLRPLRINPVIISHLESTGNAQGDRAKRKTVLQLPFLDDFSNTKIYPNPEKWLNRNAYVNNDFPIEPPTYGVATFDGLDQTGYPYNIDGQNFPRFCDTLTSNFLDLSRFDFDDSLYLSFYYQQKGKGDIPEPEDSFILEFKTEGHEWLRVWSVNGQFDSSQLYPFHQVILSVPDSLGFYHDSFQFRFMNYGNRTGALDHWHLDYVYLNQNRTRYDSLQRDISIYKPPLGLMRFYHSMPWRHYREDEEVFKSAVIDFNLHNRNDRQESPKIQYEIYDLRDDTLLYSTENQGQTPTLLANERLRINQDNELPFLYFDGQQNQNFELELRLEIEPPLGSEDEISSNNHIAIRQYFDDFFAYDDGTAEAGYGLENARQGGVALEFSITRSDTLRAIAFHFTGGYERLPLGQKFNIKIWQRLLPEAVELMSVGSFNPKYSDFINGFVVYELDEPLPINRNFFVGWEQFRSYNLNVGFDKNYADVNQGDPNPHLFYNARGMWEASSQSGCPMIRPIFGTDYKLGLEERKEAGDAQLNLFPNPADDRVTVKSTHQLQQLELYHLDGRLVRKQEINGLEAQFAVDDLPKGIYLMLISHKNDNKRYFRRLVIY